VIRDFGFPVTVYQTTYYGDKSLPIFNLVFSYLLWVRRGTFVTGGKELGLHDLLDLTTESSRAEIVRTLVLNAEANNLSAVQKNDFAAKLARFLSISYDEIVSSRRFQVMTPSERTELATQGVDFQLHTHRHRTPVREDLFRKEIQDNRRALGQLGAGAIHFCYPSGVYRPEFMDWLQKENVVSATTCETGLASARSNPFLLPRLVDTSARSAVEFEAWISGLAALFPARRKGPRNPPAAAGRVSRVEESSESAMVNGSRED